MSKIVLGILFLLFLNLVIEYECYSQVKDFQNWNALSLEKKLTKKISLLLDEEFRIVNNATQFQSSLTSLGAEYKINKYVKVKGLYRFTYANTLEDGDEQEHRFSTDLLLRYKISRFIIGYRARYQLEYIDFDANVWHGFRNKFTAKYNIPKTPLEPYAEYEFYYILGNPVDNIIDRSRYTLGADYELNKTYSISAYYRVQVRQGYYSIAFNKYILGLGLNISI